MIAAGIGGLGLAPDAFWSLTPRELVAALKPAETLAEAPGRDRLSALMDTFPDHPEGT